MVASEDVRTLGPTRLGFGDEKDVDLFVENLDRFERGELNPDDWRAFRLCNGVYGQRQDDVMMIRVKIPAGILTPPQLDALALVAQKWASGKGHVTTRQNVQFHFVKMENTEEALRLLASVGLTTREACGNAVRTITACPYAGISQSEPYDVTPYAEALTAHLLRGQWSSNLPRKFKIALGGCCGTDCVQAHINDLGYHAVVRDGQRGFRVTVGGGLSTLRRTGIEAEAFVPADQLLEVGEAVVRVFHRVGNRKNKAKARLKWAIEALGVEGFLKAYHEERQAIRNEGGRPLVLPEQPLLAGPRAPLPVAATPVEGFDAFAADSVRPQRQPGFSSVLVRLVLGDILPEQLRGVARLAVAFGEGEIRTTNEQNLLFRYIPTAKLPLFHAELAALGLAHTGVRTVSDVTSCPGASSCKLAVTQSRGLASLLTSHIEANPQLLARARDLTIQVSGCPNSCGQHHISGLGFQGGVRKVGGRAVPQYLMYLGGGVSAEKAHFGRLVVKVPARRVPQVLERLVDLYVAEAAPGEAPDAFMARLDVERVKALVADLAELTAADAGPDDFVDLGETRAFVVETQAGECAA